MYNAKVKVLNTNEIWNFDIIYFSKYDKNAVVISDFKKDSFEIKNPDKIEDEIKHYLFKYFGKKKIKIKLIKK